MSFDITPLEKIDALYDAGRDFAENPYRGASIAYQFDRCTFDRWRRKVNDFLFSLGGCDDLYYQRFSKEVTNPDMKDLENGLRILAALRDDLGCDLHKREMVARTRESVSCGRPSVSYQ
jgi:hypothetical protein